MLLTALVVASAHGCAIVHIDNQDGSTTVLRRFGVVAIEPGPASSIVQVTSVGVHSAYGMWSIGFGRTQAAVVTPGACQMVVWEATPATARSLRELIGADGTLCVIED